MKKNKDCKFKDVDMCMRCTRAWETPKGNGIRWAICKECAKELRNLMKHYNKHGVYLTKFDTTK